MKKMSLLSINMETIKVVRSIKILEKISWPQEVEKEFFSNQLRRKKPTLNFQYPKYDLSEHKNRLLSLKKCLSKSDPLAHLTGLNIDSYSRSIDMIHSMNIKSFEEISISEYGRPGHLLFGTQYSHLETAKAFIKSLEDYEHPYLKEKVKSISSRTLQKHLAKDAKAFFGHYTPNVALSDSLVSKASAGRLSVRIRSGERFTIYEKNQLLVHEIMTHTLTAINGSLQKKLPLLAMGSPRTTKTQEGLATFAEIITGSLDLRRLKRICLRVIALEMALCGADFYDLYDFFFVIMMVIKKKVTYPLLAY